jgi:hypothetical protein
VKTGGESSPAAGEVQGGLTEGQKRGNLIRLVFSGQVDRYEAFCRVLNDRIPPGTKVVLRGSGVTGYRWRDQAPFDADGPGTSDLDVTMVGERAVGLFKITGFFIPGVHSRPVSEDDPDIAPGLIELRERLMDLVGRPVNIQASREIVMQVRGDLLDQPYLTLCDKPDEAS